MMVDRFRLYHCEDSDDLSRGLEDLLSQEGPCFTADNPSASTIAFVRGNVAIRARLNGATVSGFLFIPFGVRIGNPRGREEIAVMLGHGHLPDGASRCNFSPCLETEVLNT